MTQASSLNRKPHLAGYLVGFGFLLVAGAMAMMSPSADIPIEDQPLIEISQITPGVFRVALNDPPMINIGTLNQRCNDCHSLFTNTRESDRALTQHTHVQLGHGLNDSCLNCHDKDNREQLTLHGGEVVGFDHVEQLCAQCHGPVFRDWEKGTHGKIIGYWDTDLGEAIKLTCSQCHDPHSPAYDPMEPLRGPNTLRMGDQHVEHEIIDERNPLQRWRLLEENTNEHGSHSGNTDHAEHEGDDS